VNTENLPGSSALPAPRPPLDELIARARALRPLLAERAAQTEADRRVAADVIAKLADQDLLALCKPARFGGFEFGPSAMVLLGYELGQACGSTAWCANLANCNSWFASYWPLQAQQDLWGQDPGNRLAAPLAPTGKVERTEGGYRVSGRWAYASNCENSDWTVISALLPEDDHSPGGAAWFLTPMDTVKIDQGTWHMAGMQGTGSKTLYSDEPVFVPEHRMVLVSEVIDLVAPGTQIEGNPMARFGFSTFGATALVGPMLGMARGALDAFIVTAKSKIRANSENSMAHNPFVQSQVGRASATIDAALRLLMTDVEAGEQAVFSGKTLETVERVQIRRDLAFAAGAATGVVNDLFAAAGSSAADLGHPLQRFWRDVNAAAGHVSLDDEAVMSMTGRQLFGLPPAGFH
jgi:resorcinol 4-hydroxylase (FADH2)